MGRVVVVGSLNEDLVVRTRNLPSPGETVRAIEHFRSSGGKGGNQAVAARRAGAVVSFVGATGDHNGTGRRLRRDLDREGIDTSALSTLRGVESGLAIVTVDDSGENHVVIDPGANDRVNASFVRKALDRIGLFPDDVLVTCFEIPVDGITEALSYGRQTGAMTVLNPSPARTVGDEIWSLGPLVVCNRHEALLLTGEHDVQSASSSLATLTRNNVIVTLGGDGALASLDGRPEHFPAPKVEVVVDTTGAGDTFCGVFAAGQAEGASARMAIMQAVEAASLSVGEKGARSYRPRPARSR